MEVRKEDTAERRRRILDATIAVLAEIGADRLTVEAVAERADMATRTIYNHFATRDELIAEALGAHLAHYRENVRLEFSEEGAPPERLRQFVAILYGIYAQQGASLTTLLDHREVPAIDAQIREMRAWRRLQLERILRDAKPNLRVPLTQAVALAYVMTHHSVWAELIDSGLTPAKAVAVTTSALDAALFQPV